MPKVDRWARLTVRLPAATYRRLEALAEEIPGMTPNALIRLAVEQLTPQLEAMAHALKAARSGQHGDALELLVALTQASRGRIAQDDHAPQSVKDLANGIAPAEEWEFADRPRPCSGPSPSPRR